LFTSMRGVCKICLLSTALAVLPASLCVSQTARPDPPSPAELRRLADRVLENQHLNDQALYVYERIERVEQRNNAGDPSPSSVRVFRVFPAGTGVDHIPFGSDGQPPAPTAYERELRHLEESLAFSAGDGPRQREAYAKLDKHKKERADLLDATRDAFTLAWLGRESRNGRTVAMIRLDPNPAYKSASRLTAILPKARGIMWIDEATGQLARFEAELLEDITFGGGIVAKVYKGGHFVMEQAEVAPGVWLPVLIQYDFDGRKFFFATAVHEKTVATGYRRIGPPKEAIQIVRGELSNLSAGHSDP